MSVGGSCRVTSAAVIREMPLDTQAAAAVNSGKDLFTPFLPQQEKERRVKMAEGLSSKRRTNNYWCDKEKGRSAEPGGLRENRR